MKQEALSERLKAMQITSDTKKDLRDLRALISDELPGILRDFYAYMAQFPSVGKLFSDQRIIEHASDAQYKHWMTILNSRFDEEYVESATRIGQTHARIGLEPRWYIAGYNFIINNLLDAIAASVLRRHKKPDGARAAIARLQSSFMKAALMDMDLAISVYLTDREDQQKSDMQNDLADTLENNVGTIVQALAAASEELDHTARSMAGIAEQTSSRAVAVSAAMEQATTNVASVANSAGQMGDAITDISKQVSHASGIAAKAVSTADETNQTMERLTNSTTKIGEVVSLISDIAAQTNLLALNATIESARAGEAGKGFAVVASEVKSLATQTAKATEDIATQIQDMQAIAKQSVDAIDLIRTTISEINQVTVAINAAVEEQSASTREIARNTQEAADGARDATAHVADVQKDASETGAAASEVVAASSELGKQAEGLNRELQKFLDMFRAA